MISTLYVSHSMLEPAHAEAAVSDLVALSIVNNRHRKITGALLFTGTHFAQILEGREEAVSTLMKSIRKDARHKNLVVLSHTKISRRKFRGWSLAYSGPSLFIARHIWRLSSQPAGASGQHADRWLTEVMQELVAD